MPDPAALALLDDPDMVPSEIDPLASKGELDKLGEILTDGELDDATASGRRSKFGRKMATQLPGTSPTSASTSVDPPEPAPLAPPKASATAPRGKAAPPAVPRKKVASAPKLAAAASTPEAPKPSVAPKPAATTPVVKAPKHSKKVATPVVVPTPKAKTAPSGKKVAVMASVIDYRSLAAPIKVAKKEKESAIKDLSLVASDVAEELSKLSSDALEKALAKLGFVPGEASDKPSSDDSKKSKKDKPSSDSGREIGEPHPDDKDRLWDGKKWVSKEAYDAKAGKSGIRSMLFGNSAEGN